MLDAAQTWKFRLNDVSGTAPDGTKPDPCQSGHDFWVCLSGTSCLSQKETCTASNKSALPSHALPLSDGELLGHGMALDVRDSGPVVGRSSPTHDLARGGLCHGFSVGGKGETVTGVYYFVEAG